MSEKGRSRFLGERGSLPIFVLRWHDIAWKPGGLGVCDTAGVDGVRVGDGKVHVLPILQGFRGWYRLPVWTEDGRQ